MKLVYMRREAAMCFSNQCLEGIDMSGDLEIDKRLM